jgi:hypothetical protein
MYNNYMVNHFIANDLGIYNNYYMYEKNSKPDINKHMEHGMQFIKFKNTMNTDNEFSFLQNSSSPEYGSIIEALEGHESTQTTTPSDSTPVTAEEESFKILMSEYSTLYMTYTATMLSKDPSDVSRREMEAELNARKNALLDMATIIMNNIRASSSRSSSMNAENLQNAMNELNEKTVQPINTYDENTISGKIETTKLNMTSMYYHYIVYFFICLILISFTFNIFINQNADVMNAIIVVGALLLVFLISKKYSIYI